MTFQELLAAAAGKYGKYVTTVGTALNAPQLVPGGAGAALQNWASPQNQRNNLPLVPTQPAIIDPTGGKMSYNTPQILGAKDTNNTTQTTTSGGGGSNGGNTSGTSNNSNNFGVDLAGRAFEAAKDQARSIRENGQNTFQSLLDQVSKFRDRAKELYTNSDQQITNTSADTLGSNARTAQELAGESRARARAVGLGDSSKFTTQNKVDANLAATQGNVLAKKGENQRANDVLLQTRNDQADTNTATANDYLKQINDYAGQVENAGVNNYGGALDNLLARANALSAINIPNAQGLSGYTPDMTGIINTLNGLITPGTSAGTTTIDTPTNLADNVDIVTLLKQKGLI